MQNKIHLVGRILRLPEVIKYTGLGRSSIYIYIKEGSFPDSIRIGGRSVGWLESEITAWIDNRIQASRNGK